MWFPNLTRVPLLVSIVSTAGRRSTRQVTATTVESLRSLSFAARRVPSTEVRLPAFPTPTDAPTAGRPPGALGPRRETSPGRDSAPCLMPRVEGHAGLGLQLRPRIPQFIEDTGNVLSLRQIFLVAGWDNIGSTSRAQGTDYEQDTNYEHT